MYGDSRDNSKGIDVFGTLSRQALESALERHRRAAAPQASCLVNGLACGSKATDVFSPVDQQMRVGSVRLATPKELEEAERVARAAQPAWDARGGADRGRILRAMADALEAEPAELLDLISREAGRTIPDAISEVREAVDFLRFYAAQAEAEFEQPQVLPGPTGEANSLSLHGRGVFVCISPWNFPLAIFTGQVAAALAAGNTVLAKPAEQTSLIAHVTVQRFFAAGLPPQVLQLLLGTGAEVAAPLIADGDIDGVAFTGSTATAKRIQLALAQRPGAILPLIAETGGLNAMVVDSTALLERACDDILASAFGSAGQRCSALRMLLIQEDIADDLLGMLSEALQLLRIGKPWELSTDVGPVIDHKACKGIQSHLERMEDVARPVAHLNVASSLSSGNFVAPHIIEIKNIAEAPEEVFGPVLHVVRWNLNNVYQHMQDLKGTGYGLTFGVHSRLDRRQDTWARTMGVGNTYINRSMVGAVVGSQPFGGSGLSGTGPKAGGPHYLYRFATERCLSVNTTAIGGNTELFRIAE
jgi:RHH-type proline utilization regulon transcriptional repressor/proline dehydrogenase/delta 1-pyrroline-5-carboxylate dehydrogenase